MKRALHVALTCGIILATASVAAAQPVPQPVVRVGNWLEVANELFMHIIATADIRYATVQNMDFENRARDRTLGRAPNDSASQLSDSDASWALLRLGAEFRYQKNLELYLLFEHRQFMDGNLVDDRSNNSNPGGTDVFGRAASTENPGFRTERYWIRYTFPGTPLKLHVGADLWHQDQAGLVGDDDPRFALFGEFGNVDVLAAAVIQHESQRLGLENDNDFIYYTFSVGYNLKPHRFQWDVTYFRNRFAGADTQAVGLRSAPLGFTGQKADSVLLMGSWSGRLGPVRALVQGNLLLGTARGGTAGLPAGVKAGRRYDIFAGGVVAYAEVDLGSVQPFLSFVYGSGDGDPTDNKLHGFSPAPQGDVTQHTAVAWFAHLDTSRAYAGRDYACPARAQGVRQTAPATNPWAVGGAVLGGSPPAGGECNHTTGNPFNQRLGTTSHLGLRTAYSNPGTLVVAAGLRVTPLKGHEIVGWYVYRGMITTTLLETAFLRGTDAGFTGNIGKTQYHEFGGFWMWTLNPYFDIRLSGNIALPGNGFKDLARLANCNPGGAFRSCDGNDPALVAELRFRARF